MSSFFRSRHFVFGVIACVDVCFLLAEKERCQSAEEVLLKELCVLCDSAFKTSTRNLKFSHRAAEIKMPALECRSSLLDFVAIAISFKSVTTFKSTFNDLSTVSCHHFFQTLIVNVS